MDAFLLEAEEDQENEGLDDYFLGNVKNLVVGYLRDFFSGKDMYCGGHIHPKACSTDACVDLAMNTTIEVGVERAYGVMKRPDSGIVLRVFSECGRLGIPKCFRAGILLVYLKLCYGCNV
jgi:hypothetical protein